MKFFAFVLLVGCITVLTFKWHLRGVSLKTETSIITGMMQYSLHMMLE